MTRYVLKSNKTPNNNKKHILLSVYVSLCFITFELSLFNNKIRYTKVINLDEMIGSGNEIIAIQITTIKTLYHKIEDCNSYFLIYKSEKKASKMISVVSPKILSPSV